MILRSTAWDKAGLIAQVSRGGTCRRFKSALPMIAAFSSAARPNVSTRGSGSGQPLDLGFLKEAGRDRHKSHNSSSRPADKDLVISVFESSPTKRDARQYLQNFHPESQSQKKTSERPPEPQGLLPGLGTSLQLGVPHVAVVKLREPQSVDDVTFTALGKTLGLLQALGMPSIVVIDCDHETVPRDEWWSTVVEQTERVFRATGSSESRVADSALAIDTSWEKDRSRFTTGGIFIGFGDPIIRPLREGSIVIVPAYACDTETLTARPVDSNELVLALTRYLTGLQFPETEAAASTASLTPPEPTAKALVERVIVIDPLGGPPAKFRPNGAHMFLNMAEEFETALQDIDDVVSHGPGMTSKSTPASLASLEFKRKKHAENLELTKSILSMLPSTSSVVITTPEEAANVRRLTNNAASRISSFLGTTGTRRARNPLIHNLLTDRPVHSSSLPLGRISASKKKRQPGRPHAEPFPLSKTTLAKRGMPLTVIPDPRVAPWTPPKPGAARLRLTDLCVDLPRLVHLIEDSFGRKLDVQHYLDRVSESMAGIIIAGEYEGGAILTWERPFGMDEETAYRTGRMVPYLDKFAVLRKSQGAGGVADIVFNAMVRSCFPEGVCWRSRSDNPVNKWYFERSSGHRKLSDTNWTMFWTTEWSETALLDYEDVCRGVQPSWADMKHILD